MYPGCYHLQTKTTSALFLQVHKYIGKWKNWKETHQTIVVLITEEQKERREGKDRIYFCVWFLWEECVCVYLGSWKTIKVLFKKTQRKSMLYNDHHAGTGFRVNFQRAATCRILSNSCQPPPRARFTDPHFADQGTGPKEVKSAAPGHTQGWRAPGALTSTHGSTPGRGAWAVGWGRHGPSEAAQPASSQRLCKTLQGGRNGTLSGRE